MESVGLLEVAYFQVDAYFPYLSGRSISKPNFFKYLPKKIIKKNKSSLEDKKENPFNVLKQINFK